MRKRCGSNSDDWNRVDRRDRGLGRNLLDLIIIERIIDRRRNRR